MGGGKLLGISNKTTLGGQIPKSIIVCEDVLTYSFECVLSLVFLEKESMFMIQNSFKMRKE